MDDFGHASQQRSYEDLSRHDLHVWPMSTTETALTAHLLTPGGYPGDSFAADIAAELKATFGIGHVTLHIETDPATPAGWSPTMSCDRGR